MIIQGDTLSENAAEGKAEELLSELRALARLNHPNIVRYHHSWTEMQPAELHGDSSRRVTVNDMVWDLIADLRIVPSQK